MVDLRIVLGLILFAFVTGVWTGISVTENDVAVVKLHAANAQTKAIEEINLKHNQVVSELRKINDEALTELERINATAAVTADTGDSLQHQYTASLCKPVRNTDTAATIPDGAADATASLVHSYVFGVVNQRAITYAKIADESRLRGLTCEAEYAAALAVRF